MRLRIDVKRNGAITKVFIAGELLAEGVPELEQATGSNRAQLELDLAELRFADSDGVEAIRGLVDSGATTIRVSPFIAKLIDAS